MKINRKKLLDQLTKALPGIENKQIVEQSNCFVFDQGKVATFNDEVACLADVDLDVEGAIPAAPLLDLLQRLSDAELDIEMSDEGLVIKGKGRRSVIRFENEITLPIDSIEQPEGDWIVLPEDFCEAVSLVSSCAGSNQAKFFFVCVHLTPEWIEAADDLQICRHRMDTGLKEDVLVRATSIKHVVKFGMRKMNLTNDWLHFADENDHVLSCRRFVGGYPDVSSHLEIEGNKATLPKGLKDAVSRCRVFSREAGMSNDLDEVRVELRPNGLRVTGEGSFGKHQEKKKVSYDGDPIEFMMSANLLTEIEERSKEKECRVAPGKIKIESGNWEYVTCTAIPKEDE